MKSYLVSCCLMLLASRALAQVPGEIMDKRARELRRVIGLDDKVAWEKFVKENYSPALLAKPVRAQVSSSENGAPATTESKTATSVEEKASLFERLHQDFGNSKIISLTPRDNNLEMVLENRDGLRGTFKLKFQPEMPYLIDGLGVNVVN